MTYEDLTDAALRSAQFELEYERVIRCTERIYEEERARILRVQMLLQEDANDEICEVAEENEDALQHSEDCAKELQDRLDDMVEQYENTQSELKACMRDIDQYQAEINALNMSSTDSTKVLTEKLALSRELNILKPELEHLRSQISQHDNILADKLSLERELATAQLELDSEKRTVTRLKQRTQSTDPALTEEIEELKALLAKERKTIARLEKQSVKRVNERSAADSALVDEMENLKAELEAAQDRAQVAERRVQEAETKQSTSSSDAAILDELRKDLTKERKVAQKLEREQLKKTAEWDGQKEAMESKLDAFRTKLRGTKEQLKVAQDELERLEAAKFAESSAATKARMRGASVEPTGRGATTTVPGNLKKRPIARFDPDMTIGTPGHGAQATKRQRLTGSMVGDKSTFSITPFLNRTTMSILPESPGSEGEKDEHDKINEEINTSINELAEEAEREEKAGKKPSTAGKKPEKKLTAPKNTTDKKARAQSSKASASTASAKHPALARVQEEETEETEQGTDQENPRITAKTTAEATASTTEITNSLSQPKKKKILGARRTIFDDDDDGAVVKKPMGFGLNKVRLGPGNNKPKVLAVFSPLKKDRKGPAVSMVGA